MALTLEVTSRAQRDRLGDHVVRQFGREGGTIGRAEDNDWRLPDPERYISSHHATIDFQAGSYYLIDTSMNGVYINGSDVPVGRAKPQRLFDGDVLRMGEYIISVTIDEGFELLAEEEDHRSSIAREDLVQLDDDSDEFSLVDAEEITGARELSSRLFGDTVTDTHVQRQKTAEKKSARPSAKVTRMPGAAGKKPARPEQPPSAAARESTPLPKDAVEAFLRGLGMSAEDLGNADSRRILHNAGLALREFVLGAMELLQNRAAVKNSFRLEQTTIQPGSNNPLKFSASADDAVRTLLTGSRNEYGPAVDSVREAVRDLKHHEIAVICAMREALDDFADRFDPEDLEQKFEGTLKRNSLFGGNSKAKYWDLYSDLYEVLTRHAEGKLPGQFGEDFARAYAEHLERLERDAQRRGDGDDRARQAGR
ncbi:type VI secretion system-associated FHA domain protein TagH [Lentisalinibacter salinarum]|uniref:type VI secretion system-associated FHA domain protein TagH n=1 Tax=Lentisalinibacter salinarum TaxID=2992239 RepID=UPI0038694667